MSFQILPSLLAADIGHLADEMRRAENAGADSLHLDIMDAAFVPNLSFGPSVVALAKKTTTIPLNVHLMMMRPDRYIEDFIKAGADTIQIHVESSCHVASTLDRIRTLGAKPAIVLNPLTPHTSALPYLDLVDECLQMTVFPGYGGQKFKPEPLPQISLLRDALNAAGRKNFTIMVDGGIDRHSIVPCANAGANAFVAGTSLFTQADMKAEIKLFRGLASAAFDL